MELKDIKTVADACLGDGTYLLPVGYADSDGNIHRKVKIGYLLGETEEKMAEPKIKDNGGKITTELVLGVVEELEGVVRVKKDTVREMAVADRDFIAFIHRKSLNETIEFEQGCMHCKTPNAISVKIDDLELEVMGDNDARELTFELPIGVDYGGERRKTITIMMPNGAVQERVASVKNNPVTAITMMLTLITKQIEGIPHLNPDLFKKMTKKDRDFISKELNKFTGGVNVIVEETCVECGETFKAVIPFQAMLGE